MSTRYSNAKRRLVAAWARCGWASCRRCGRARRPRRCRRSGRSRTGCAAPLAAGARELGERALTEPGAIPARCRRCRAIVLASVTAAAIHQRDADGARGLPHSAWPGRLLDGYERGRTLPRGCRARPSSGPRLNLARKAGNCPRLSSVMPRVICPAFLRLARRSGICRASLPHPSLTRASPEPDLNGARKTPQMSPKCPLRSTNSVILNPS